MQHLPSDTLGELALPSGSRELRELLSSNFLPRPETLPTSLTDLGIDPWEADNGPAIS